MSARLELNEDPAFEHAFWRVQRAAWLCIAGLITLAIFGLFSSGPLDRTEVSGHEIRAAYSRFERMSSPTDLHIRLDSRADEGSPVTIRIDRKYLRKLAIENIVPEPQAVSASAEWIVYSFGREGATPIEITVHAQILEGTVGLIRGRIGTDEGAVHFWQFVWP